MKNATPKCTSISQGYIENLKQTISGDSMNTIDRHHIDFISFNMKCPNIYAHAHFPT